MVCGGLRWFAIFQFAPLLKTGKDLCHRKGQKRTFGYRKGLLFAILCTHLPKNFQHHYGITQGLFNNFLRGSISQKYRNFFFIF